MRLARFLLTLAFCYGVLGHFALAHASHRAADGQDAHEQIDQYDGRLHLSGEERQQPVATSWLAGRQASRVASTRPIRLLPTHGPKPSRSTARWADTASPCYIKHTFLHHPLRHATKRVDVAPPRCYYVIALRRLLC